MFNWQCNRSISSDRLNVKPFPRIKRKLIAAKEERPSMPLAEGLLVKNIGTTGRLLNFFVGLWAIVGHRCATCSQRPDTVTD